MLEVVPVSAPERIIRMKTVKDRTGLSRSTIYRKITEGTFPRQQKLGVHGAGWHKSAINRRVAKPAAYRADNADEGGTRSDEHTSELQSLMRISYAVFCLKKKNSP